MQALETKDLDLASAIQTATGIEPDLAQRFPHDLVTFSFPTTPETRDVVLAYTAGTLVLDVRRLLNRRAWLYREVSAMRKGARR